MNVFTIDYDKNGKYKYKHLIGCNTMKVMMNERSWSFGPEGKDINNWMGGDDRPRRPTQQYNNRHSRRHYPDKNLIRAEFQDKFPSIPSVRYIDNGFSTSIHQKAERVGRDEAIDAYAGGKGNRFIAVFWTDRGNPSGAEYHWITDNGIVIITNEYKNDGKEVITKLIARPEQITRYQNDKVYGDPNYKLRHQHVDVVQVYPSGDNWKCPQEVLDIAKLHQDLGLNYMEESIMDSNKVGQNTFINVKFGV